MSNKFLLSVIQKKFIIILDFSYDTDIYESNFNKILKKLGFNII